MYLKRKIDSFLQNWKNDENHLPLIVKGARQIGKTESINEFSKKYKNVVYINFALEPIYKMVVNDGYDVDKVVKNISAIDSKWKLIPNETLIIFDEIQDFPDITTTLKSFAIDKRYDVICSGSLLGINYKKIHSISLGYKSEYEMYSMDFEEFLWALDINESVIDDMFHHMTNLIPFSKIEMNKYMDLFTDYVIVGGMPNVVKNYVLNKNFQGISELQKDIVDGYKDDARKYIEGLEQTKIINTFNSIPVQLAKDNKKFQYSKISNNARSREYIGVIEWLNDVGIINICYQMNFPELPIKGNIDSLKFKVYMADTGLLVSLLDEESQIDLKVNKNLGVYKGAIFENVVAEALKKSNAELVYYKRADSTLEIDFFVRTQNELMPIEVKSGNNKSKSLNEMINNNKYVNIKRGIKLAYANVGFENNIFTIPYFCSFLIKRWVSGLGD